MKNNNSFTIIELLVVISVIAILVGVAFPKFKGMQDEANISKARAELRTLQTAVESYYMHQDPPTYPESTSSLCGSYLNDASPLIVSDVLYDPFNSGEEYDYLLDSGERYYVIFSVGPDGEATISEISDEDGAIESGAGDDIFVTNGIGVP